ncbi:MAG: formate/nitrite transporter [Anaerolineales bacterium]|nr:formate/nitrite transporter [Anaerolineales bacterium]
MAYELQVEALMPEEMARRAEYIGVLKSEAPFLKLFFLAILAGSFIALGAIFATTVAIQGAGTAIPFGVNQLLVGLAFCLGLILVIVAGAELFTGNNLIVMAWASGKISLKCLLRNWAVVYLGNFIGSILVAGMYFLTRKYQSVEGALGETMLDLANGKVNLGFWEAFFLAILCNFLVCLAVWLTYSARSTGDKIMAILFPITAFVAAGFEHSIANMYFVPAGLFIKIFDPAFAKETGLALESLTWGNFLLRNLFPVTMGNVIGGALMVAGVYWVVYRCDK